MAGKFQLITELYAEAAGEVSRDREAWKGFLTSAGFNYRLRFDEQLLICFLLKEKEKQEKQQQVACVQILQM